MLFTPNIVIDAISFSNRLLVELIIFAQNLLINENTVQHCANYNMCNKSDYQQRFTDAEIARRRSAIGLPVNFTAPL